MGRAGLHGVVRLHGPGGHSLAHGGGVLGGRVLRGSGHVVCRWRLLVHAASCLMRIHVPVCARVVLVVAVPPETR